MNGPVRVVCRWFLAMLIQSLLTLIIIGGPHASEPRRPTILRQLCDSKFQTWLVRHDHSRWNVTGQYDLNLLLRRELSLYCAKASHT
jgi:hypothetical protein